MATRRKDRDIGGTIGGIASSLIPALLQGGMGEGELDGMDPSMFGSMLQGMGGMGGMNLQGLMPYLMHLMRQQQNKPKPVDMTGGYDPSFLGMED